MKQRQAAEAQVDAPPASAQEDVTTPSTPPPPSAGAATAVRLVPATQRPGPAPQRVTRTARVEQTTATMPQVVSEMRRIGLVTGVIAIILVVLYFVLR